MVKTPHWQGCKRLLKAKIQAKVPSLEDQVASAELFITRAKKRFDDAEARVVDAITDHDRLLKELDG